MYNIFLWQMAFFIWEKNISNITLDWIIDNKEFINILDKISENIKNIKKSDTLVWFIKNNKELCKEYTECIKNNNLLEEFPLTRVIKDIYISHTFGQKVLLLLINQIKRQLKIKVYIKNLIEFINNSQFFKILTYKINLLMILSLFFIATLLIILNNINHSSINYSRINLTTSILDKSINFKKNKKDNFSKNKTENCFLTWNKIIFKKLLFSLPKDVNINTWNKVNCKNINWELYIIFYDNVLWRYYFIKDNSIILWFKNNDNFQNIYKWKLENLITFTNSYTFILKKFILQKINEYFGNKNLKIIWYNDLWNIWFKIIIVLSFITILLLLKLLNNNLKLILIYFINKYKEFIKFSVHNLTLSIFFVSMFIILILKTFWISNYYLIYTFISILLFLLIIRFFYIFKVSIDNFIFITDLFLSDIENRQLDKEKLEESKNEINENKNKINRIENEIKIKPIKQNLK